MAICTKEIKKGHLPSCVPPSGKQVQYQNEETKNFDTGIAFAVNLKLVTSRASQL